ncbi:UNVERIFIED_ORG: pilus assembly protein CpaB [Anoxybacillus amylolyticus]
MKKKQMIVLFLQLVLMVGFAASFYRYVQVQVQPVDVYVFSRDLSANDKVSAGDIQKVSIPAKAVTEEMVKDPKTIVGKYLVTDVFSDQFVYKNQLVKKGDVDPFKSMDLTKLRKISLPISYVEGFGGNLKRGDRVDLVFTGEGTKETPQGEKKFRYAKVFLQDVYVYNVTTADGYKYVDRSESTVSKQGEEISTSGASGELAVVTLAVTLEQAEEIVARMNAGQIRLLARFGDSESYETLGFVLGDYQKVFSGPINAETSKTKVTE